MPEYMYACHVSSTVTCQYYTSRTYYHNESPISFLPELLRIWPRDTRAISISLCFSSIERYKIIRVYSVAMEDRVSWTTLGRERNISCELTAKKLPRHFLCVLRSRARTIRTHCVCIAIVAEGLRFESCDQNKRNREEIETRVCELVDIVCNG